jgi:hypothetical protein
MIEITVAEQIKQELVTAFKMQSCGLKILQIAFDMES